MEKFIERVKRSAARERKAQSCGTRRVRCDLRGQAVAKVDLRCRCLGRSPQHGALRRHPPAAGIGLERVVLPSPARTAGRSGTRRPEIEQQATAQIDLLLDPSLPPDERERRRRRLIERPPEFSDERIDLPKHETWLGRRCRGEGALLLRVVYLTRARVVTADQPDELLLMHLVAVGIAHVLLRHGTTIAGKVFIVGRLDGRWTWLRRNWF